jgi:class 3 adenylate cyclase
MIIVHYEVYVLEGRGWMLHARFPRTERETAILEAKELENTLGVRVRVLRETYYTDDNSFEEAEVYSTQGSPRDMGKQGGGNQQPRPSGSRQTTPARAASGGSAQRPAPRIAVRPLPRKRQRPPEEAARARQLMARLLAITAVALAAALLSIKMTPEAIQLLWKVGFNMTVTRESYGQLLFLVFVCTFLLVAVPLAMRFLPRQTAIPQFRKPGFSFGGGDKPALSAEEVERERKVKKSLDKLAAQALAEERRDKPEIDEEKEEEETTPPFDPKDLDLPEIKPGPEEEALPEIRPDPEPQPEKRPEQRPEAQAADPAQAKADTKEKAKEKSRKEEAASVENLQPSVMRFLDGAVAQAKVLVPNMDAFTKFALHLYLAGAVETLCDFKKLGEGAKAKLVGVALETLGTRGDLARKFYEKLEEYLLEPRYLGVVQAGRDAMGDFMLGNEGGAHRALRDAFLEWTKKSDKKAQIVTVMFTDMVGSTDMTQARGDAAAQEVVRRHNSIVRGALAQFGGKEIKHTGDGIMASFGTAAAAVEASVAIQRQVHQHNNRLPAQSLHLRIGLNAGEPIEEEDDLFGATVQLAARVCAATNADQVLCTGVVKDLTVGKGAATFQSIGNKYLKGFKDAVPLYEVVWGG